MDKWTTVDEWWQENSEAEWLAITTEHKVSLDAVITSAITANTEEAWNTAWMVLADVVPTDFELAVAAGRVFLARHRAVNKPKDVLGSPTPLNEPAWRSLWPMPNQAGCIFYDPMVKHDLIPERALISKRGPSQDKKDK